MPRSPRFRRTRERPLTLLKVLDSDLFSWLMWSEFIGRSISLLKLFWVVMA